MARTYSIEDDFVIEPAAWRVASPSPKPCRLDTFDDEDDDDAALKPRLRGPRRATARAAPEGVAREQGTGEEPPGLRRRGAPGARVPGLPAAPAGFGVAAPRARRAAGPGDGRFCSIPFEVSDGLRALCAAVVTADNLAKHRADLNGAPPSKVKARSDDSSEDEQRRRRPVKGPPAKLRGDLPVDVGADVESNLSRAVKALLAALRGDDGRCDESEAVALASCLRIAYTALGEHYLTVARVTKAARHFSEGVQLFRGLGDAQTAAWLRGRLAFAQATVAGARRRPVAAETPQSAHGGRVARRGPAGLRGHGG